MLVRRTALLGIIILAFSINVALSTPHPELHSSVTQMLDHNYYSEINQVDLNQLLKLTPEQNRQIAAKFHQNIQQMLQNQQALKQATQDLLLLMEGTATSDQIREKYRQIQELYSSLENMRFENMLVMREILLPEQRQQLFKILQKQIQNIPQPRENPNGLDSSQQQLEFYGAFNITQ